MSKNISCNKYVSTSADTFVNCNCTSSNLDFYLFSVGSQKGKTITITKTDASNNTITIYPATGETIDGASTLQLASLNASVVLEANETGWISVDTADNNIETEISRSQGFFFDKDYYYQRNTKLISSFQSDETWTSVTGTQSADSTNVKIGTQGIKILENNNTAGELISKRTVTALDLTKFTDGSASTTSDYIALVAYVSDVTKLNATEGIDLYFSTTGDIGAATDFFYYFIPASSLATGWNYIKVAKSAFTIRNAASWASIAYLGVSWTSLVNAQNAYVTFNGLQLVRKDPSANVPNPFQREVNGVWAIDFAINYGEWFIGLENNEVVCRELLGSQNTGITTTASSLVGTKAYNNFIASASIKALVTNTAYSLVWEVNSSNRIRILYSVGTFYILKDVAGTQVIVASTDVTAIVGETIEFKLVKNGSSITAIATKNNTSYVLSGTISDFINSVGYLAIATKSTGSTQIKNAAITTTESAYRASVADVAKRVQNLWVDWTPTVAWTTGTPEGSVAQTARYTTIGNTCYFNYSYTATDGNDASALTITLPVTPKDNNAIIALQAQQKVNASWTNPLAYIDDDSGGIAFRSLAACTNAQAVEVIVTGFYEVL